MGRVEQNPVGSGILAYGFGGMIVAKIVGTVVILILARFLTPKMASWAMKGCCVVMLGVVVWNVGVIVYG